ncbi:MAG: hypothetical protein PGMFKBFP_03117 [Anaerolineales bacterium]|nr:hypothetical protein [Anaerolineales bacterium]
MWDNLCGCGMDIMAVYNYDKARLLRFTRNDRRKRIVIASAVDRGSLKKGIASLLSVVRNGE